jgi:hypothetical protein
MHGGRLESDVGPGIGCAAMLPRSPRDRRVNLAPRTPTEFPAIRSFLPCGKCHYPDSETWPGIPSSAVSESGFATS